MSQVLHKDRRPNVGAKLVPHVVSEYHGPKWFMQDNDFDFLPTVPNKGDYVTYTDTDTGSTMVIINDDWKDKDWSIDLNVPAKDFPNFGAVSISFGVTVITNNSVSQNYYSPFGVLFEVLPVTFHSQEFRMTSYNNQQIQYSIEMSYTGNLPSRVTVSPVVWFWFSSTEVVGADIQAMNKSIQSLVAETVAIEERLNKMDALAVAMEREIQSKLPASYVTIKKLKVRLADRKPKERKRRSRRIQDNLLKLLDTDEEISRKTKILNLL